MEEYESSGIGKLNRAAIVTWLYVRVPTFLRLFVTTTKIEKMIDDVMTYAKEKRTVNLKLKDYVEDDSV